MDNERDRTPLAPFWTDLIDAINALLIYRNGITWRFHDIHTVDIIQIKSIWE